MKSQTKFFAEAAKQNGTYTYGCEFAWFGVKTIAACDLARANHSDDETHTVRVPAGKKFSVEAIAADQASGRKLFCIRSKDAVVYGYCFENGRFDDYTRVSDTIQFRGPAPSHTATQTKSKETTMKNIKDSLTTTNHKAVSAARKGVEQAAARTAHKALVAQVKKLLGPKFPKAFFATPMGAALLDLGSCYLVMLASETMQHHPLATKANAVAVAALTAATYDHAAPLIATATKLVEAAAGINLLPTE